MTSVSSQRISSGSDSPTSRIPALWRGVLIGLLPLGILTVMVAAAIALTAGARALISGQDFFAERLVTSLTLGSALAIGFIMYAIAIIRTWGRITTWQLTGQVQQAKGALWTLALTALIVLLPVIIAFVFPQHHGP